MSSFLLAPGVGFIEDAVIRGEACHTMTVHEGGRTVARALEELRVHPALQEIGFCAFLPELGEAARSQDKMSTEEPIFITQTGLILAGFGRWRVAVSRHVPHMECVEYSLTDEDALQFMLSLQKRRNGWNPFVRIRLALKLEGALQQRALINMQMGGKHKGSATLPKAAQIDVREQIAAIAGVGCRNVSKVKEILEKAHSRIKGELLDGSISINRAHLLCRLPLRRQLEALTDEYCNRVASEVEEELLFRHGKDKQILAATAVLNSLQQQELQQPGSVSVQVSRRKRSVILVGKDLQTRIRQSMSLIQPRDTSTRSKGSCARTAVCGMQSRYVMLFGVRSLKPLNVRILRHNTKRVPLSMEIYGNRRRPKGSREYVLKIYVMSSIADDYEDFEMVSNTATKWAEGDGLHFDQKEILRELVELIGKGYAQAYILSAYPPHTVAVDYSEERVGGLSFMLTSAGIRALNELDGQPSNG